MSLKTIKLPPKLKWVFSPPRGELRIRGAYGGRGSGKSMNFATMACVYGAVEKLRILCTRDLQDSIKESFYAELKNAIAKDDWLSKIYDVGADYIRCMTTGTEFFFKGLRHNIDSIKSMAQIDICIVEEAEDVPQSSWDALMPTIRAPKSEIWVIWNPKRDGSPVDFLFRKNTFPRSRIVEMNYTDNPWFPAELDELRLKQREIFTPEKYWHIWHGGYLVNAEATIFANKWKIDDFVPSDTWDGPYHGLDFGFANDPTAAVKMWINDHNLYFEYDASKSKLELDHTSDYLKRKIPGIEKHTVRADNARPESISYLKRHGLPRCTAVEKGKGSVEDGIEFMKSFDKIIVHSRCVATQRELMLYSYKTDKYTGDPLPVILDENNHCMDAARYALEPIMKANKGGLFDAILEKKRKAAAASAAVARN